MLYQDQGRVSEPTCATRAVGLHDRLMNPVVVGLEQR